MEVKLEDLVEASKQIKKEKKKTNKIIGLEEEQKVLEKAIEQKFPTLLVGETGVGKTYLVRHLAKKQSKNIHRVPLNGEVGINELLGKWLVKDGSTYWQDGILVSCMKNGDWILLDEINAALPEVLFCLNSIMDDSKSIVLSEKNNEKVDSHPDFRIFATMNPCDEYAGTKELNKALLSRFIVVMWMSNYEPVVEKKILKYQSGVDDYTARIMVDVSNSIRELKSNKKIFYTCSLRDIISWGLLFNSKGTLNLTQAFRYSVLNKADESERRLIFENAKQSVKVDLDWDWGIEEIKTKLTAELQRDIEKLEKKKAELNNLIGDMQTKISTIKDKVNEG